MLAATVVGAEVRTNVVRPVENIESDDAGYKWGGITPVFVAVIYYGEYNL
jgi:hypothetical protein